jgi:hypothetical protein
MAVEIVPAFIALEVVRSHNQPYILRDALVRLVLTRAVPQRFGWPHRYLAEASLF